MVALEHFRNGRLQIASDVVATALRSEPNNPQLWHLAGNAAKGLGQLEHAEGCWRNALVLDPGYAEAHYNLGVLLQEQRRAAEAAAHYQNALARPAWQERAQNNLGVMLMKDFRAEEALRCFGEAVALNPAYGKAHHNRGRALVVLGRFEEAREAFETALQLVPETEKAHVHRSLSFVKGHGAGDARLAEMQALEARITSLSASERMDLHFALGKAYDDVGEYRRSFHHFLAGNEEKRRQTPYDEAATLGRLGRIRAAYSPELMTARSGRGCATEAPIFIVGMPRSGSTLVEQILASHPDVHGAGECEDFFRIADEFRLPDGAPLVPDGIAKLPDEALRDLGARYLGSIRARAPDARRIVDKTLVNFQHVGLIHLALPRAKIIHTLRDAVETCLSCFVRLFQGEHPYSYELSELGRYWRAQQQLMDHWKRVLPPGVLIETHSEALADDLEGGVRRLLEHCDLDWNPACLEFHKTERPIYTASAAQVRKPIFRAPAKAGLYGELVDPLRRALEGAS